MTLTVKEKEHWKQSIERKVKRAIDGLYAQGEPGLQVRIEKEAKQKAFESLGIREWQERLDAIAITISKLKEEKDIVSGRMIERLKTECADYKPSYDYQYSVEGAVTVRQKRFQRELLAQEPLGRKILSLEDEQEELLDTVWLATSSNQIKELWTRVSKLLEQPPTGLQREALEISADSSS